MAHSHVCLDCGRDLARFRAAPEPTYGWWIVRCPDCGRVAVRRRHPLGQLLRRAIRLDAALTGLAVRLVTALVVGPGILALANRVADHLGGASLPEDVPRAAFVLAALAPVALGTWITVALAHWRPLRAWAATAATLAAVLVLVRVDAGPAPATLAGWAGWTLELAAAGIEEARLSVPAVLAVTAAGVVGVPVGLGLRWTGRAARRARFRWYRRAARRGRFVPG